MDIRRIEAEPTVEERAALDALLGPPESVWSGGPFDDPRDAHVATFGGRTSREMRHMLLPALQALQARAGWISEGGLGYVCDRLNVPPADAWGVATFYALLATTPRPKRVVHVCDDIGCKVTGVDAVVAELERTLGPAFAHGTAKSSGAASPAGGHAPHGSDISLRDDATVWMKSPCLGMCDRGPAALVTIAGPSPTETLLTGIDAKCITKVLEGRCDTEILGGRCPNAAEVCAIPSQGAASLRLLRRVGRIDPTSLAEYRSEGGYAAFEKAMAIGPAAVIEEVKKSKLMGRGGAAFPTAQKWEAVAKQPATPHYLVCNADESEPGTYKDRVLMDHDPFALVEAMAIAAFATGCSKGFIYVRGDYPLSAVRLQHAIDEARAHRLLGPAILGSPLDFDIEIRRGAGAYICGEETAVFESIEGRRGEPRSKPPFPVQVGLFGKPTVVNNVETLANIPLILLEGGDVLAGIGTAQSTGTRLFCVSGHVKFPGVYEAPFGITLRSLIDMAGGLIFGRQLKAVLLGGAAGTFVRPDEIDLKLTHEDTRAANTTLGSGVVMVFDDTTDLPAIVRRIAAFFRDESCGQCVPCRVGTVRQEEALHRIAKCRPLGGMPTELALLEEIGVAMKDASICGLGQTAYAAVESAIKRLRLYDVSEVTP